MSKLSDRAIANMESVLEETCRILPNGGDHKRRKYIAEKLKQRAMQGATTLAVLRAVAHDALLETKPKMHS